MNDKPKETAETSAPEICGIVMPISEIAGRSKEHWADVRLILESAIQAANFKPALVSDSDSVQVIHSTIVQNLYNNSIVVCDISAANPNVMFELGFRVGVVKKPVILVKDDETKYEFDTQIIETLQYPRSLRHPDVEKFKTRLADKIKATVQAHNEKAYTAFVDHFSPIKIKTPEIETRPAGADELRFDALQNELRGIRKLLERPSETASAPVLDWDDETFNEFIVTGLEPHEIGLVQLKFPGAERLRSGPGTTRFFLNKPLTGKSLREGLATILKPQTFETLETNYRIPFKNHYPSQL